METLLPSEVARLVLGYLEEENCEASAKHFLEASPNLSEIRKLAQMGRKYPTRVNGYKLIEMLDEYCLVHSIVQDSMQKLPFTVAEQLKLCGSMIEQLRHLVSGCSCQRVEVNITLHPQQGTTTLLTSASSKSSVDVGPETITSPLRGRLKKGIVQHGESMDLIDPGTQQVSATPLENLPGMDGIQPQQSVHQSPHPNPQEPSAGPQHQSEAQSEYVPHQQSGTTADSEFQRNQDQLQHQEEDEHNAPDEAVTYTPTQHSLPGAVRDDTNELGFNLKEKCCEKENGNSPAPQSFATGTDPLKQAHINGSCGIAAVLPSSSGKIGLESQNTASSTYSVTNIYGSSIVILSEKNKCITQANILAQVDLEPSRDIQLSQGGGCSVRSSGVEEDRTTTSSECISANLVEGPSENVEELDYDVDVTELKEMMLKNKAMQEKLADNINRVMSEGAVSVSIAPIKNDSVQGECDEKFLSSVVRQSLQETEQDPVFEEFLLQLLSDRSSTSEGLQGTPNAKCGKKKKKCKAKPSLELVNSTMDPPTSTPSILVESTPHKIMCSQSSESGQNLIFSLPAGVTPAKQVTELNDMTPVSKLIHAITDPSGEFYMEPSQFANLVDMNESCNKSFSPSACANSLFMMSTPQTELQGQVKSSPQKLPSLPNVQPSLEQQEEHTGQLQTVSQPQQRHTDGQAQPPQTVGQPHAMDQTHQLQMVDRPQLSHATGQPQPTGQRQPADQPQQLLQPLVADRPQQLQTVHQILHVQQCSNPLPHENQPSLSSTTPTAVEDHPLQQIVKVSQPNGTTVNVPVIVCSSSQQVARIVNQQGASTVCEGVFKMMPSNNSFITIAPKLPDGKELPPEKVLAEKKSKEKKCLEGLPRIGGRGGLQVRKEKNKVKTTKEEVVTMYSAEEGKEQSSVLTYKPSLPFIVTESEPPDEVIPVSSSDHTATNVTTTAVETKCEAKEGVVTSETNSSSMPVLSPGDTNVPETAGKTETESKAQEKVCSTTLATANSQSSLLIPDNSLLRDTPGLHLSIHSRGKRLSMSTPRRRKSHIRALDFSTPPKEHSSSSRKANTSPKNMSSCALSPLTGKKLTKSCKRGGFFKSPTDGITRSSKVKAHLFKSPEYLLSGSSGYKVPSATFTSTPVEKNYPIATRSPGEKLSSAWDKVAGVGLILDTETSPVLPLKPQRRPSRSWDSDLRSCVGSTEVGSTEVCSSPNAGRRKRKSAAVKGEISPKPQKKLKTVNKKVRKDETSEKVKINNSGGSECELAKLIEVNILNESTATPAVAASKEQLSKSDSFGTSSSEKNEDHPQVQLKTSEKNVEYSKVASSASVNTLLKSDSLDIEDKITTYVIEKDYGKKDLEAPMSDESAPSKPETCTEGLETAQVSGQSDKSKSQPAIQEEACALMKNNPAESHFSEASVRAMSNDAETNLPEEQKIVNPESCIDATSNNESEECLKVSGSSLTAPEVSASLGKTRNLAEAPVPQPDMMEIQTLVEKTESLPLVENEISGKSASTPGYEKHQEVIESNSQMISTPTLKKMPTPVSDVSTVNEKVRVALATCKPVAALSFFTPMKEDMCSMVPHTPRILSPNSLAPEETPMTKLIRSHIPILSENSIQTPSLPPTPTIHTTPAVSPSGASQSTYFQPAPSESSEAVLDSQYQIRDDLQSSDLGKGMPGKESTEILKSTSESVDSSDTPVIGNIEADTDGVKKIGSRRRFSCVGRQDPTNLSKKFESSKSVVSISKPHEDIGCARATIVTRKPVQLVKTLSYASKQRWVGKDVLGLNSTASGKPSTSGDETDVSLNVYASPRPEIEDSLTAENSHKLQPYTSASQDIGSNKECTAAGKVKGSHSATESTTVKSTLTKNQTEVRRRLGVNRRRTPKKSASSSAEKKPLKTIPKRKMLPPGVAGVLETTCQRSSSALGDIQTSVNAVDKLIQNNRDQCRGEVTSSSSSSYSSSSSETDSDSSSSSSEESTPAKKISPCKQGTPKFKPLTILGNTLEAENSVRLEQPLETSTPCTSEVNQRNPLRKEERIIEQDDVAPRVNQVFDAPSDKKVSQEVSKENTLLAEQVDCQLTENSTDAPLDKKVSQEVSKENTLLAEQVDCQLTENSTKTLCPLGPVRARVPSTSINSISVELEEKRKRVIAHVKKIPYKPPTFKAWGDKQEGPDLPKCVNKKTKKPPVVSKIQQPKSPEEPKAKNELTPVSIHSAPEGTSDPEEEDFPCLHISSDEKEDPMSSDAREHFSEVEKEIAAIHGIDGATVVKPCSRQSKKTPTREVNAEKDLGLTTPQSDSERQSDKPSPKNSRSSAVADQVLKSVLEKGLGRLQSPPKSKIQKLGLGATATEHEQQSIIDSTAEPISTRDKLKMRQQDTLKDEGKLRLGTTVTEQKQQSIVDSTEEYISARDKLKKRQRDTSKEEGKPGPGATATEHKQQSITGSTEKLISTRDMLKMRQQDTLKEEGKRTLGATATEHKQQGITDSAEESISRREKLKKKQRDTLKEEGKPVVGVTATERKQQSITESTEDPISVRDMLKMRRQDTLEEEKPVLGATATEQKQQIIIDSTEEPMSARDQLKKRQQDTLKEEKGMSSTVTEVNEDLDYEYENLSEKDIPNTINTSSSNHADYSFEYNGPDVIPPARKPIDDLRVRIMLGEDASICKELSLSPYFSLFHFVSVNLKSDGVNGRLDKSKSGGTDQRHNRGSTEKLNTRNRKPSRLEKDARYDNRSSGCNARRNRTPSPDALYSRRLNKPRSSNQRDVATDRRDVATVRRDHSTDRRDLSTDRKDRSAGRRDHSTGRRDRSSDRRDRRSKVDIDSHSKRRRDSHITHSEKQAEKLGPKSDYHNQRNNRDSKKMNKMRRLDPEEGELLSSDVGCEQEGAEPTSSKRYGRKEKNKQVSPQNTKSDGEPNEREHEHYSEADLDEDLLQFAVLGEDSEGSDKEPEAILSDKIETPSAPQRRAPPRSVNAHKVAHGATPTAEKPVRGTKKRKKPVSPTSEDSNQSSSVPVDISAETKPTIENTKGAPTTKSPLVKKLKQSEVVLESENLQDAPKDTLKELDIDAFLSKLHGANPVGKLIPQGGS